MTATVVPEHWKPGMPLALMSRPQTPAQLWQYVATIWGIKIPWRKVCPQHTPPFTAFAAAYFAWDPVMIWKASRGFGGKSRALATLTLTEAVLLAAQSTVLGGSSSQSQNVHAASTEAWHQPYAPRYLLDGDPTMFVTRLNNGAWIKALLASQKSARGPHPQRLRLDEIDEMELPILEAAQGQPMDAVRDGRLVEAQTVMSSTHQYPDKTMNAMLKRAEEYGWPVYEWCWRENLLTPENPEGWLSQKMVDRQRQSVSKAMWETEYDLQEPSFEGRAIDTAFVEEMFDREYGSWAGAMDEDIIAEPPKARGHYVTGVDWAKEKDWTVIWTFRTDVTPWRTVAWKRTGRRPWPHMVRMVNRRLDDYPGLLVHDATGIGNVVSDLLETRSQVTDVVLVGQARATVFSDYIAAIESAALKAPRIDFAHSEHRYATIGDLFGRGHPPDSFVAGALAWSGRAEQRVAVAPVVSDLARGIEPLVDVVAHRGWWGISYRCGVTTKQELTGMALVKHLWGNGTRGLMLATMGVIGTTAAAVVLVIYVLFFAPQAFDPLGVYPVQRVLNRVPGVDGPALYEDEVLEVEAVKCNDSDAPVRVTGTVRWVMVEPTRTSTQATDPEKGTATRIPGCETTRYSNALPDDLIKITKREVDRGATTVVWHLDGVEYPIDPATGLEGEPRVIETQNFRVLLR